MFGIAVVCAVTLAFIVLDFVTDKVDRAYLKKRNRAPLYVARDKNGKLWLYMGKPIRCDDAFIADLSKGNTLTNINFRCFGLNENDYVNLKCRDEPVEVFLKLEN